MSKERITPKQAQAIYDAIRNNIRLAKFNDSGLELPHIDMTELFHGRKSVHIEEITTGIQSIIEDWKPSL